MPKRNDKEKLALNEWFIQNYSKLKETVRLISVLDEDMFHDAYLTIVTKKSSEIKLGDLSSLFVRTYKSIIKRRVSENYTLCRPDEVFFELLSEPVDDEPQETDHVSLAKVIAKYISSTFSIEQKAVWQMRLQGFSVVNTADALGLRKSEVTEMEKTVRERTKCRFAMAI